MERFRFCRTRGRQVAGRSERQPTTSTVAATAITVTFSGIAVTSSAGTAAATAAGRWSVGVRGCFPGLFQGLGKGVLVQAGSVERAPAAPVRQREAGGAAHVVGVDAVPALPCGQRDRGAGGDHVRAHPVHVERGADRGDLA